MDDETEQVVGADTGRPSRALIVRVLIGRLGGEFKRTQKVSVMLKIGDVGKPPMCCLSVCVKTANELTSFDK
jgi:hypothetical protein